jgi:hypothetical protein
VGPWKDDHLQSLETESQLKCSLMQNVEIMQGFGQAGQADSAQPFVLYCVLKQKILLLIS